VKAHVAALQASTSYEFDRQILRGVNEFPMFGHKTAERPDSQESWLFSIQPAPIVSSLNKSFKHVSFTLRLFLFARHYGGRFIHFGRMLVDFHVAADRTT